MSEHCNSEQDCDSQSWCRIEGRCKRVMERSVEPEKWRDNGGLEMVREYDIAQRGQ